MSATTIALAPAFPRRVKTDHLTYYVDAKMEAPQVYLSSTITSGHAHTGEYLTLDEAEELASALMGAVLLARQRLGKATENGPTAGGSSPEHSPVLDGSTCSRLLVGRGDDTYDPECILPRGHSGVCSEV